MAKTYKKKTYYNKKKYNIENRPVQFTAPSTAENSFYQNSIQIVPPSTVEGVRQVARMTITLTNSTDRPTENQGTLFWAIVYIPEGVSTTALFPTSTVLFQPSNYVLASGVSDGNAGPIRISSRLRKNLNAGDQIFLLTATGQASSTWVGLIRYAICFK